MRKKIVLILTILLLPAMVQAERQNLWEVKLPFEEGTIEYTISGVENGTETLYLRNFGNETARYRRSVMQVMGIEKITETVDFTNSEWLYSYDLEAQTGTKRANPNKYLREEYAKLSDSEKEQALKNMEKLGLGYMPHRISGEIEQNAMTILGMNCDKAKFMETTVYTIHDSDIPLQIESNIMEMMTLIKASSVREGVVPERFFKHPQGITLAIDSEADAVARSMAQEEILMLTDPDAVEKVSRMGLFKGSKYQPLPDSKEQQDMEQALEALKNIFEN